MGKEICEYVKLNPKVVKKTLKKKICEPIEDELLGRNSIDIFLGPESGPEHCPSHVWSFETCLNL